MAATLPPGSISDLLQTLMASASTAAAPTAITIHAAPGATVIILSPADTAPAEPSRSCRPESR